MKSTDQNTRRNTIRCSLAHSVSPLGAISRPTASRKKVTRSACDIQRPYWSLRRQSRAGVHQIVQLLLTLVCVGAIVRYPQE